MMTTTTTTTMTTTTTTNGRTYQWFLHVLIVRWCMWYRSHRAGDMQMHNFEISAKTVEVQCKTDGMGINTHRHHVGTIQKNLECEKSKFCHLPSCNLLKYLISRCFWMEYCSYSTPKRFAKHNPQP